MVTGHTGFKGSWISTWLMDMGAKIHGLALAPETTPNLHNLLELPYKSHSIIDLRDRDKTTKAVQNIAPQLVIHMAAQPLVRRGYKEPVETFATNVMGTANLLDALRNVEGLQGALVVTSDKAYDNRSYQSSQNSIVFTEKDALGGQDPYSASKGAQDIVANSFARSYFDAKNIPIVIARAGNVIGGGDWSEDRLMTDVINSLTTQTPIYLRNPDATRPWQHVLEPVAGYLMFLQAAIEGAISEPALNFGPDQSNSVDEVVTLALSKWGEAQNPVKDDSTLAPKEAQTLALSSSLAKSRLGWAPRLDLPACIDWIVTWHKCHLAGNNMHEVTLAQILAYENLLDKK